MNFFVPWLFMLGLFGLIFCTPFWFWGWRGEVRFTLGMWAALALCILCSGVLVGAAWVLAGRAG